jgi:hypothetical protein
MAQTSLSQEPSAPGMESEIFSYSIGMRGDTDLLTNQNIQTEAEKTNNIIIICVSALCQCEIAIKLYLTRPYSKTVN